MSADLRNLLDRNDLLGAEVELSQGRWVEVVNRREAASILPEESRQPQLCQNTNDV